MVKPTLPSESVVSEVTSMLFKNIVIFTPLKFFPSWSLALIRKSAKFVCAVATPMVITTNASARILRSIYFIGLFLN